MRGNLKVIFPFFFFALFRTVATGNEFLEVIESDMVRHLEEISQNPNVETRILHSDSLRLRIIDAMDIPECFDYPFDSVKSMSILKSSDKKIRIFNWNLPLEEQTHVYFCFVLHYDKKSKSSWWEELIEGEESISNPENKYLKYDQWIGALYYDIIPVKISKNKTNYTLLGWDGNDRYTTRKIIDVYSVQGDKTRLGAPIFKTDKGTQKRYIIEYSSEVMVTCRWREKEKRIVFDHVAPRDPSMEGIYSYYGPDLTYDSFVLEKEKWVMYSNVDVRNDKSDKPYHDPGN